MPVKVRFGRAGTVARRALLRRVSAKVRSGQASKGMVCPEVWLVVGPVGRCGLRHGRLYGKPSSGEDR